MASQAACFNGRDINAHDPGLEAAENLLKISQCARINCAEDVIKRAAITLTEMRLNRRLSSLDDWSTGRRPKLPLPSRVKENNNIPGPSNSNISAVLVDSDKKTKPDASSQAPRKRAKITVESSDRITRSKSSKTEMRSEHSGDSLDPPGTVVCQPSASATSAEESDIKVTDNVESAERTVNCAEKRDVEPLGITITRPTYRIIMPSFRKRKSPQD